MRGVRRDTWGLEAPMWWGFGHLHTGGEERWDMSRMRRTHPEMDCKASALANPVVGLLLDQQDSICYRKLTVPQVVCPHIKWQLYSCHRERQTHVGTVLQGIFFFFFKFKGWARLEMRKWGSRKDERVMRPFWSQLGNLGHASRTGVWWVAIDDGLVPASAFLGLPTLGRDSGKQDIPSQRHFRTFLSLPGSSCLHMANGPELKILLKVTLSHDSIHICIAQSLWVCSRLNMGVSL